MSGKFLIERVNTSELVYQTSEGLFRQPIKISCGYALEPCGVKIDALSAEEPKQLLTKLKDKIV